jgi:hypothetical protein
VNFAEGALMTQGKKRQKPPGNYKEVTFLK